MNDIRRSEASSRELHAVEFIAGLDERLNASRGYLEKRLRSVPDCYRQYRIAETAVGKVLTGLYSTMEVSALNHMLRVSNQSEIVIRPKSVLNRSTDSQVVLTKDLITVVNAAVGDACSMCIKTGRDVKRCELRKALLNMAPLDKLDNGIYCGYSHVGCNMEDEADE